MKEKFNSVLEKLEDLSNVLSHEESNIDRAYDNIKYELKSIQDVTNVIYDYKCYINKLQKEVNELQNELINKKHLDLYTREQVEEIVESVIDKYNSRIISHVDGTLWIDILDNIINDNSNSNHNEREEL